jgi:transcriptional regulator with PAS, ATPase and Fis domain
MGPLQSASRAMRFTLHVGSTSTQGTEIGDRPIVVGRSRDADVVVADPRVSRRHVEVSVASGRVVIRTIDDASPFSFDGRACKGAVLSSGDRIVLGDTVLVVGGGTRTALPTVTRTRPGGLADEARALAAITDLVASLEEVDSDQDAERAVGEWTAMNIGVPSAVGEGLARVASVLLASRKLALADRRRWADENASLRTAAVGSAREFLGVSAEAELVQQRIAKLARSDATALVVGESGTGKTFAARLIHEASARAKEPLRIINCAAIPGNLLEAELFGAERGAFSGAIATRIGAFEAVGKGTLVLDEIGELDGASQAKLLHVLEERAFERLGSNKKITLDARVIAATNRDLGAMVEAASFRRDLFFRVSVVTLSIPPLRERRGDVLTLAGRILADLMGGAGRRVEGFTPAAALALQTYPWPGNVRELRNVIEHAIVLGEGTLIDLPDLPEHVARQRPAPAKRMPSSSSSSSNDVIELPARLDWLEAQAIEAALRATGGNRTKAAAILGINRVTLQKKLGPQRRSE